MADIKFSGMPSGTPSADDLVPFVDDPGGTPANKQATFAAFNKARAFIGCKLYRSTTQLISTATWTAISFDSEDFDSDGFHENVTNPTRITIPAGLGGKYLLTGYTGFAPNTTGIRQLNIYKNGVDIGREFVNFTPIGGGNSTYIGLPGVILSLAAADYVEFMVYQNSGGALNATNLDTTFSAVWLGA